MDLDALRREYEGEYGTEPAGVVRSPGRVNLIGEHTDYNDGFVCPMAIEPAVYLAYGPRDDATLAAASTAFPDQPARFDLAGEIPNEGHAWERYVRGSAHFLRREVGELRGLNLLVSADLPNGGGLSSSAALEVGAATAMLAVSGKELDGIELAKVAQRAEQEYAGMPCGIMDQMAVATCKRDRAMLLDCRDLSRRHVRLDPGAVTVLVVNSMHAHQLTGSEYPTRRRQCEEGARVLGVDALRDATIAQVEAARGELGETVFKRCRHVVGENARAVAFAEHLEKGEFELAGELMAASHASLSEDYEVSTGRLDWLAAEAAKVEGVYGSRMTGGGFGGCTVSLVAPGEARRAMAELRRRFESEFGEPPTAFLTEAADAAGIVGA